MVSVMTDRIHHPPLGFRGGENGAPNAVLLDGAPIDPKARTVLPPGSVVTIATAGGAGYGPAAERAPDAHAHDLAYGYVADHASARD